MTPQPTRPDLMPRFQNTCTCAADGTRDENCYDHRASEDDDE